MNTKKQLITVCGSSGVGKTVLAAKLGNVLAKRKKNVVLISADESLPLIPLLMPFTKDSNKEKTLGNVWAINDFSQDDILSQCVLFSGESRYSLLSYDIYDKRKNHTSEMAADLIFALKQVADYIIVDCCTNFFDNPLSVAALKRSDYIIKIMNPDPKSILATRKYAMDFQDIGDFFSHINVMNNIYPWEDTKKFYEGIGEIAFNLPHSDELLGQYASGKILDELGGGIGDDYRNELLMISQRVLFGGEDNAETVK